MVGLAGMAASSPAPLWPEGRGLKLVRPLLRRSREDLRDQLREARLEWIEDPSNLKTEYARVRARQTLASWEQSGLGVERWAGLADLLAWHVGGLDGAARTLIEQGVRFEGPAALVDIGALASTPRDVQHRALGAVIAAAGAAERAPDEAALDRVLAALGQGRTIGGAQLKRKNDSLEVGRDPGGVTGRGRSPALAALDLPPGEEVVWDGRLALLAHEPGWRAEPAEGGQRPLLRHGNRLETLEDASKTGAVIANWLLRERIAHLLWR
jgi:tRNA(Ile)-lysidine synthase